MAKRLTREEKINQVFIDLINKMFEIAGHNVTYNDIKDRKDDWFTQWTMTMQQNDEWQEWGINELSKRLKTSKKKAEFEMGMMSLAYGLKLNDSENLLKNKD
jgi:hypothetical protein